VLCHLCAIGERPRPAADRCGHVARDVGMGVRAYAERNFSWNGPREGPHPAAMCSRWIAR